MHLCSSYMFQANCGPINMLVSLTPWTQKCLKSKVTNSRYKLAKFDTMSSLLVIGQYYNTLDRYVSIWSKQRFCAKPHCKSCVKRCISSWTKVANRFGMKSSTNRQAVDRCESKCIIWTSQPCCHLNVKWNGAFVVQTLIDALQEHYQLYNLINAVEQQTHQVVPGDMA